MENQVSIILNGVRYDAVENGSCNDCSLYKICNEMGYYDEGAGSWYEPFADVCNRVANYNIFKKSDKKFEP